MSTRIVYGIVAGLAGGVIFGIMMSMMSAPTPDGGSVPMMQMVASVVRSDSIVVAWVYHLFNSALIGLIFAVVLGSRAAGYSSGLLWGALYGVAWWVLGGLILMPVALNMPPLAPLLAAPMVPVALGSLVGHIVYGLVVGAVFVALMLRQGPAGKAKA